MRNSIIRFLKNRKYQHGDKYPRKLVDSFLEYLRFTKVEPYIPKETRLLDIGTGDGNFLRYLNGHLHTAIGIDSHLTQTVKFRTCQLIPGYFPYDFVKDETFDVITMLATVEHIPMNILPSVADACWEYLIPGGQVIITVQHPRVEKFLDLLKALRIVQGFSIHEHYGFEPECLPNIFNRWKLIKWERWGFKCNNLFIFEKPLW